MFVKKSCLKTFKFNKERIVSINFLIYNYGKYEILEQIFAIFLELIFFLEAIKKFWLFLNWTNGLSAIINDLINFLYYNIEVEQIILIYFKL